LSPLAGTPILEIDIKHTPVTDLAPLRTTALQILSVDQVSDRDLAILSEMKTLERINGESAASFAQKRKKK
jgi:hypothetical protein